MNNNNFTKKPISKFTFSKKPAPSASPSRPQQTFPAAAVNSLETRTPSQRPAHGSPNSSAIQPPPPTPRTQPASSADELHRSKALYVAKDYAGSLAAVRNALRLAGNSGTTRSEILYSISYNLFKLGQYSEGVEAARQAIACNVGDAPPYLALASNLQGLGHLQEAKEACEKGIASEPNASLAAHLDRRCDDNDTLILAQSEVQATSDDVADLRSQLEAASLYDCFAAASSAREGGGSRLQ